MREAVRVSGKRRVEVGFMVLTDGEGLWPGPLILGDRDNVDPAAAGLVVDGLWAVGSFHTHISGLLWSKDDFFANLNDYVEYGQRFFFLGSPGFGVVVCSIPVVSADEAEAAREEAKESPEDATPRVYSFDEVAAWHRKVFRDYFFSLRDGRLLEATGRLLRRLARRTAISLVDFALEDALEMVRSGEAGSPDEAFAKAVGAAENTARSVAAFYGLDEGWCRGVIRDYAGRTAGTWAEKAARLLAVRENTEDIEA